MKPKGWNGSYLEIGLDRTEAVVLMRLLAWWTDDLPTLKALGAYKPGLSFSGVSVQLSDVKQFKRGDEWLSETDIAERCLLSMAREIQRTVAARTRMSPREFANADLSFVCERCLNEAPTTGGADG